MNRHLIIFGAILAFACGSFAQSVFPFADTRSIPRFGSGPQFFASDFETFLMASSNKTAPSIHWKPLVLDSARNVTGNFFRISNPHGHLSILPPLDKQCGKRVTASSNAQRHGCRFASNAGFFNVKNGDCIGNLISESRIIQTSDVRVANFGVRGNKFVVGYVDPATINSSNPAFSQLVAGVGWLVRNGEVYLEEAMKQEHISEAFRTLLAPRIAIGHDAKGHLLILEVNGYEPAHLGFTLDEMANSAKALGAVNMINLDGGGSVTTILNGQILNYCSDACSESETVRCPAGFDGSVHCERTVTSIICVT